MHRKAHRQDGASTMLATSYQQTRDANEHLSSLGLLLLMGCFCIKRKLCVSIELAGNCQTNNKDKGGLDTTETDRTAPEGVVHGSNQASPDNTQINTEGGM